MAYALVGSVGTVVQSSSGGAISGLAYPQTATTNHLLIAWWSGDGAATLPSTPTGWSIGKTQTGTSCAAAVYWKVAAGADAVPAFAAVTSSVQSVQLAEFSGNLTSAPNDQVGGTAGTTSTLVATATGTDAAAGELIVYSTTAFYSSTSGTKTLSNALNNGATAHNTTVPSTVVDQYDFGYGITTGNGSADADTLTFTTTHITGAAVALVSFKAIAVLAGGAPATYGFSTGVAGATQLSAAVSATYGYTTGVTGTVPAGPPVAGVLAWYAADQIPSPPSSGSALATWNDLSGNGHDLTQATGGDQPTYNTSQLNGLPAVSFNGSSDYLSGTIPSTPQPFTVFLVMQQTSATGTQIFMCGTGASWDFYTSAGSVWMENIGHAASLASWSQLTGVVNTTSSALRLNGTQIASGSSGGNSMGTTLYLGGLATTDPAAVAIAEVLVYPSALSPTDIGTVESYLNGKYGLGSVTGVASATYGFTASGIATETLPAAASTTYGFSSSATGSGNIPASATATYAFSGSATGSVTVPTTASTTYAYTGSALTSLVGTASATYSYAGSVTGTVQVPATAAATYGYAASVAGTLTLNATASGTYSYTTSTAGIVKVPGIASATYSYTTTTSGTAQLPSAASGTYAFNGTVTGTVKLGSGAAAIYAYTATATGVDRLNATASATYLYAASAMGGIGHPPLINLPTVGTITANTTAALIASAVTSSTMPAAITYTAAVAVIVARGTVSPVETDGDILTQNIGG